MNNKIVIIGANSFQNKLIIKAKQSGYETHVFAWQCNDIGEKTADYFYPISIIEKGKILEICKKIQPVAVCSIASDLAVLTVNYVARELGLVANSEKSDLISTNKFQMRKTLCEAGISTPSFFKVTEDAIDRCEEKDLKFPLIVKPTDRSGSRAITKLTMKQGLKEAIKRAIDESFEHAAIVEGFLEGKEYSCECISYKGTHHLLAITEKFTTGAPNYIEVGHIEPALIDKELFLKIRSEVFKALDALEIKNSASHTEFKVDSHGNIGIVEVGARMGGDCIGSDLVYLSTGNDYVKMVIDVACGKEPKILNKNKEVTAAIRFLMTKKDVALLEQARRNFHVIEEEFDNNIGDHLVVDSGSRYGYFIITSADGQKIRKKFFE